MQLEIRVELLGEGGIVQSATTVKCKTPFIGHSGKARTTKQIRGGLGPGWRS